MGVGGRGSYYDKSGAMRDMVQNHMMQLLCLIAMEPPYHFDPDAVRDEKGVEPRAAEVSEVEHDVGLALRDVRVDAVELERKGERVAQFPFLDHGIGQQRADLRLRRVRLVQLGALP